MAAETAAKLELDDIQSGVLSPHLPRTPHPSYCCALTTARPGAN